MKLFGVVLVVEDVLIVVLVEVLGRRFGGNGGGSVCRFGRGGFGGGLASKSIFSELYDGRTLAEVFWRISRSLQ